MKAQTQILLCRTVRLTTVHGYSERKIKSNQPCSHLSCKLCTQLRWITCWQKSVAAISDVNVVRCMIPRIDCFPDGWLAHTLWHGRRAGKDDLAPCTIRRNKASMVIYGCVHLRNDDEQSFLREEEDIKVHLGLTPEDDSFLAHFRLRGKCIHCPGTKSLLSIMQRRPMILRVIMKDGISILISRFCSQQ